MGNLKVGVKMLKGLNKWKVLNSKEVRAIADIVQCQWGCGLSELRASSAFLEGSDGDIFLISRAVEGLDLEKIRIDSLGLYFGQLRNNEFRLSIEGSQLVGNIATKNVVEIDDTQLRDWLGGNSLEMSLNSSTGYVIIKHNDDFLGCGKCKDGKILNFVPKARRIASI